MSGAIEVNPSFNAGIGLALIQAKLRLEAIARIMAANLIDFGTDRAAFAAAASRAPVMIKRGAGR